MENYFEKNIIAISGQPGTGKTFLSKRICTEAISKGINPIIIDYVNEYKDFEQNATRKQFNIELESKDICINVFDPSFLPDGSLDLLQKKQDFAYFLGHIERDCSPEMTAAALTILNELYFNFAPCDKVIPTLSDYINLIREKISNGNVDLNELLASLIPFSKESGCYLFDGQTSECFKNLDEQSVTVLNLSKLTRNYGNLFVKLFLINARINYVDNRYLVLFDEIGNLMENSDKFGFDYLELYFLQMFMRNIIKNNNYFVFTTMTTSDEEGLDFYKKVFSMIGTHYIFKNRDCKDFLNLFDLTDDEIQNIQRLKFGEVCCYKNVNDKYVLPL